MIVVRAELHSAITHEVTTLDTVIICNDGTGTKEVGNYDVRVLRRGAKTLNTKPKRHAKVKDHQRLRDPLLTLLKKALEEAGY